jgi:hypothetical protein
MIVDDGLKAEIVKIIRKTKKQELRTHSGCSDF